MERQYCGAGEPGAICSRHPAARKGTHDVHPSHDTPVRPLGHPRAPGPRTGGPRRHQHRADRGRIEHSHRLRLPAGRPRDLRRTARRARARARGGHGRAGDAGAHGGGRERGRGARAPGRGGGPALPGLALPLPLLRPRLAAEHPHLALHALRQPHGHGRRSRRLGDVALRHRGRHPGRRAEPQRRHAALRHRRPALREPRRRRLVVLGADAWFPGRSCGSRSAPCRRAQDARSARRSRPPTTRSPAPPTPRRGSSRVSDFATRSGSRSTPRPAIS